MGRENMCIYILHYVYCIVYDFILLSMSTLIFLSHIQRKHIFVCIYIYICIYISKYIFHISCNVINHTEFLPPGVGVRWALGPMATVQSLCALQGVEDLCSKSFSIPSSTWGSVWFHQKVTFGKGKWWGFPCQDADKSEKTYAWTWYIFDHFYVIHSVHVWNEDFSSKHWVLDVDGVSLAINQGK